MGKFCRFCANLLTESFANDVLSFRCQSCQLVYKAKPEDTLRYEKTKESDTTIYETILNRAVDDPATIKARVDCIKKCGGKIVKQVRVGDDMKLFNICVKCHTRWLN